MTTTPTFDQVLDMACQLTYAEQQQLLNRVAGNLYMEHFARLQERKARIQESEQQIAAGDTYSEEEANALMEQIVEQISATVAA